MSENRGVWGVEIGQAGLKAIRLRYAEAAHQALAVAFDYVPHPKILSQPDAIPEELIPQALEKFLSRNEIKSDAIAISVPGQAALTRFIQLPPVQASKVADIVKYEARQQIPFALEDVIWDYQVLSGDAAESEFMVDAEVGLFAMKREQVMQQLKPFNNAKLEVELIQVAPLALYNVLSYDLLGIRTDDESVARDEYTILLDMGADNTTLLVSNGQKIWIRNVPIGGNHFTRALTKEMKLTFAKAEHLKCNATKSPDPRAVFQALRPVFNDYVSEIQRSIGYFSSVNRNAKIAKVVGVGNGFKLAGLQKFLQQNLQYPVERLDRFQALAGDTVLSAPLFEENILSFAVPYGLALQGLGLTRIHTSLLPPEIATARKIRRKKPWAVAAAASLLFALTVGAAASATVYRSVSTDRWETAEQEVDTLKSTVSSLESEYKGKKGEFESIKSQGDGLVRPLDTRTQWLELYKAINAALPKDEGVDADQTDISKRNRIKLLSITAKKMADLDTEWYQKLTAVPKGRLPKVDQQNPPTGQGYVFTIDAVHYHNSDEARKNRNSGVLYVQNTLLKNLRELMADDGTLIRGIGITHPTVLWDDTTRRPYNPEATRNPRLARGGGMQGMYGGMPGGGMFPGGMEDYGGYGEMGMEGYDSEEMYGEMGMGGGYPGMMPGAGAGQPKLDVQRLLRDDPSQQQKPPEYKEVQETRFQLQFVWQPTPTEKRPVYAALSELLDKNPQTPFDEAQQYVTAWGQRRGLELTLAQEDFDAFVKKHIAQQEAPATDQPSV